MLPTIKNHPHLKGKRVLLRVDFNVSVDWKSDTIISDFKIKRIIPTINFLRENGAKVIIISHIGRDPKVSLYPVYKYLKKKFAIDFCESLSNAKKKVENLREGNILLLENIRSWEGEKENNKQFSANLSELGDIYVNDAFAVSHREHASIVGIPQNLPSFMGLLFEEELKNLSDALNPVDPSLFILGGAKFETKEPLIEKISKIYDKVFVGGALANDFFRVKGYEVGRSLVSSEAFSLSKIIDKENIILPIDLIVQDENENLKIKKPNNVGNSEKIVDMGPESEEMLSKYIKESLFILWNGPLGYFEKGYDKYTKRTALNIENSSATSIIGGGDTIASIKSDGDILKRFDFVSTAGGAMIHFLLNETLPGIEALKSDNR